MHPLAFPEPRNIRIHRFFGAVLLGGSLLAAGCASGAPEASMPPPPEAPAAAAEDRGPASAQARAEELVERLFLADGHIDYPDARRPAQDPAARTSGNFDYPRARAGGLDLAFMSIYVPPADESAGTAYAKAEERLAVVEAMVEGHPELVALVRTPEEALAVRKAGKLALALGMENGAPLEGRLERLKAYRDRGVAYLSLTHVEDNHLADSSLDEDGPPRWGGLSPFGREVVAECNRLGIMVDVSHASDEACREILARSRAPVIASHSGCRALTPEFGRNLPDELIAAIAAQGGLVMIPFGSMFASDAYRRSLAPADLVTAREIALVVDHAVQVAGPEHVGLGSDFDGVGYSLPRELGDVSMYANLVRELILLGYGEAELEGILGGNLLRVWAEVRARAEG